MNELHTKALEHHLFIIGFGCIGQALLPLLFRHLIMSPEQITIYDKSPEGAALANARGIPFFETAITVENYQRVLAHLRPGDVLLNLAVGVSSIDLLALCQQKGALYLDTCTEPWDGDYTDSRKSLAARSNYALREAVLQFKQSKGPTAVLTHGANPGLVSHFVKQALCHLAQEDGVVVDPASVHWGELAQQLGIKAIHIAEEDSQVATKVKQPNEFLNTWSIDGFRSESIQPAELGWGTHERHWPADALAHTSGSQCAIYLNKPGAMTKVRTWTPLAGPKHGFLITHAEAISLAQYLTVYDQQQVQYRPTVHYAYIPCSSAILSLHELMSCEMRCDQKPHLLMDTITHGSDALGVLLMGHANGAYWYGSQLSIQEARAIAENNNATSLQVVAGVLAALLWMLEHPDKGIVEPEDIDHQWILSIAKPYLGQLKGHHTNWTPLQGRSPLFDESLDHDDPWQFLNIRVT